MNRATRAVAHEKLGLCGDSRQARRRPFFSTAVLSKAKNLLSSAVLLNFTQQLLASGDDLGRADKEPGYAGL
jgi:hypothetical protein